MDNGKQTLLMTDLILQYTPEIVNIFNYLNGRVNTKNICKMNVVGFSKNNYAQFQHPNLVSVFVGSIVEDYYNCPNPRNGILSIATLVMTHELYHADQYLNAHQYRYEDGFADNVENAAEYQAESFCLAHKQELLEKFNFYYVFGSESLRKYAFSVYQTPSIEEYYLNTVLGIFRSKEIYDDLKTLLDNPKNMNVDIAITIGDSVYRAIIKEDGVIKSSDNDLVNFNYVMMIARGGSPITYTFTMHIRRLTTKWDDKLFETMNVIIIDKEATPFVST